MHKITRHILVASVAITIGAAAFAQTAKDDVVSGLVADGYTNIEVKTGLVRTRIEAMRGTETFELVIDNATGDVIKSESGTISTQGETVREREQERHRTRDRDHGEDHADHGDDHDAGDDHGGDRGGDHGDGHEGGHGGGNGHGGDHD